MGRAQTHRIRVSLRDSDPEIWLLLEVSGILGLPEVQEIPYRIDRQARLSTLAPDWHFLSELGATGKSPGNRSIRPDAGACSFVRLALR